MPFFYTVSSSKEGWRALRVHAGMKASESQGTASAWSLHLPNLQTAEHAPSPLADEAEVEEHLHMQKAMSS